MHTVFTGNPQNLQKVPKIGVPPFLASFSGSSPLYRTPIASRWLEVRFPPSGPSRNRTFGQNLKIRDPILGGTSQNRVFRGGGLTPCGKATSALNSRPKRVNFLPTLLQGVKWRPPSKKPQFWEVPPNIGSLIFRLGRKVRGFPP